MLYPEGVRGLFENCSSSSLFPRSILGCSNSNLFNGTLRWNATIEGWNGSDANYRTGWKFLEPTLNLAGWGDQKRFSFRNTGSLPSFWRSALPTILGGCWIARRTLFWQTEHPPFVHDLQDGLNSIHINIRGSIAATVSFFMAIYNCKSVWWQKWVLISKSWTTTQISGN
jgi:hypothetical protein